jgi:hypothetical protein
LKILTIKVCETRNLESIHELHSVERENDDRKPDKNREDASLCLETSTKNVVQEFHDCFGWRNKIVGRSNSSQSIQRPEKTAYSNFLEKSIVFQLFHMSGIDKDPDAAK